MAANPKINLKILLTVTAAILLSVAFTGTALNAASFDASMTSTLRLTGITTADNQNSPSPDFISNILFTGVLSIDQPIVSGLASVTGTSVSYTVNSHEITTVTPGDPLPFSSSTGFGIGDSFTLNSKAFSTENTLTLSNATAGAIGTLNLISASNFDQLVHFNLTWSMSAETAHTISDQTAGISTMAETYIFADILDGVTTDGVSILAATLGRSVNGVGNFTDFTASTDFSVLLEKFDSRSIQVAFSEALGNITAGQAALDPVSPLAVPVPATVWLFGSALVGMLGLRRRITKSS